MENIGLPKSSAIEDDTVLITWTPWKKSMAHTLGTKHKDNSGKWLVMENGYIPVIRDEEYYAMGVDGFNGRGTHKNVGSWGARWEGFGIDIKEWKKKGDYILVVGQFGHRDTDISMPLHWPDRILHELISVTDRPIVYKPKSSRPRYPNREYPNVTVDDKTELEELIDDAWAVVVYSSKAAVTALLHGIPAFVCGPYSIASNLARKGVADINDPYYPEDRLQFFNDLAYSQWTRKEIESGRPFRRLL